MVPCIYRIGMVNGLGTNCDACGTEIEAYRFCEECAEEIVHN